MEEFGELLTPQLVLERQEKCVLQTFLSSWNCTASRAHRHADPGAPTLDHDSPSFFAGPALTHGWFTSIVGTYRILPQSLLHSFEG